MKSGSAIALIVCGTLLIIVPAAYDYMLVRNVSSLLASRTDMVSITVGEPMSAMYRIVCWVIGAIMISVALVRPRRRSDS